MAKKLKTDSAAIEAKPPSVQKVIRTVERSPAFGSYYANETQVQTGPWDVRFVFSVSEIQDDEKGRTAIVKQVAEVRMSHQHVVTIMEILSNQLKSFEQRFGKIPTPPKAGGD